MGATNLQAKIGAHIASFGFPCWQTDGRMRQVIKRSDGRRYHRDSIGRARRLLAKAGLLESKRIFPNQIPEGAKYRSTYGTTQKQIKWSAIGLRNPISKAEARKRRELLHAEDKQARAARWIEPAIAALVAGRLGAPPRTASAGGSRLAQGETAPPRVAGQKSERPGRMTAEQIDAALESLGSSGRKPRDPPDG